MPALPTWDLFITLFFIIGVAYGLILQRDKVVLTMIAVYVALAVVEVLTGPIGQFFAGERAFLNSVFIRSNASPFTIQVAIFVLVTALISSKSGLSGSGSKSILTPLELFGYSFLNSALILSSIFFFMEENSRTAFAESSRFAAYIINYHTWWILLPVGLLIVTGFLHKD